MRVRRNFIRFSHRGLGAKDLHATIAYGPGMKTLNSCHLSYSPRFIIVGFITLCCRHTHHIVSHMGMRSKSRTWLF